MQVRYYSRPIYMFSWGASYTSKSVLKLKETFSTDFPRDILKSA